MAYAGIQFIGTSFSYDGETYALKSIDLSIPPGQFVSIIGGNGSGKSTMARCINGLLIPDQGQVIVMGDDTTNPEALPSIRRHAAMVFQNPDDQLVASLVENEVAFGPENLAVVPAEIRQRVTRALAHAGLAGFGSRETHTLSGGQKQRLAIAGALAMEPSILILDEASSMLDPQGQEELMGICHDLHAAGMTIIMITHSMEEAAQSDRVIALNHGTVMLDGPPHEVLVQTARLESMHLQSPLAVNLSHDLQAMGVPLPTSITEASLIQGLAKRRLAGGANPPRKDEVGSSLDDVAPHGGSSHQWIDASREPAESHPAMTANITDIIEATEIVDGKSLDYEPEGPAALSFESVSFSYQDDRPQTRRKRRGQTDADEEDRHAWALRDLTFEVREGEFLGIAGHTGSGKSTLIQHMNGLLQATSGHVSLYGKDLAQKHHRAAARNTVGLVFQYPEHQLFAGTVLQDVGFGPRNQGLSSEQIEDRVHRALRTVGLDEADIVDRNPFDLSGGQQRRVALAGVLAMDPRILVLDEPTAGLDPQTHDQMMSLVAQLHRQGITCVMVSHNVDDLVSLCDRILVLGDGRMRRLDTPEQVFSQGESVEAWGLRAPRAQRLASSLREVGFDLPRLWYDRSALIHDIAAQLDHSNR